MSTLQAIVDLRNAVHKLQRDVDGEARAVADLTRFAIGRDELLVRNKRELRVVTELVAKGFHGRVRIVNVGTDFARRYAAENGFEHLLVV